MESERQPGAGDSGSRNSETGNPETMNAAQEIEPLAEEKAPPTVSLRKIEANRRNALRSTGPRTKRGKRFSRWNSLQHGLLLRDIVIPAGLGQKSFGEFRFLLEQLRRDLHPEGTLEEMLVEKIAACYWRFRRLIRSETGAVRKDMGRVPRDILPELAFREALGIKKPMTDEERDEWIETEEACRYVPGGDVVDKLLRYETTLERELYHALSQLERIQRRKNGEPVPPPTIVAGIR